MTIAILVIYKISVALDLCLNLSSLIFCGVFALLINFLSIPIAPFLDDFRIIILGTMAVIAAIIATGYNNYIARKISITPATIQNKINEFFSSGLSRLLPKKTDETVSPVGTIDTIDNINQSASDSGSTDNTMSATGPQETAVAGDSSSATPEMLMAAADKSQSIEAVTASINEPDQEPMAMPEEETVAMLVDEPTVEPAAMPDNAPGNSDPAYIVGITSARETPDINESIIGPITESYHSDDSDSIAEAITGPAHSDDEAIAELITESDHSDDSNYTEDLPAEPESETIDEAAAEQVEVGTEVQASDELTEHLNGLGNLDDILDYAFELKGSSDWHSALKAYGYALEHYSNDAYAPMLVIEISNIHKDNGHYQEAIDNFRQALSLPAIADNPDMAVEFQGSIAYLEAVYTVLKENNQPEIPFYDIPDEYMSKIESIYNSEQTR